MNKLNIYNYFIIRARYGKHLKTCNWTVLICISKGIKSHGHRFGLGHGFDFDDVGCDVVVVGIVGIIVVVVAVVAGGRGKFVVAAVGKIWNC